MHIVHVVQLYHPVSSGSVQYFVEIGRRLAAAGHRVTVLTTNAYDLEAFWQAGRREIDQPYEFHHGCHIHRFPVKRLSNHPLVYPILRRLLVEGVRFRVPLPILRWLAMRTPRVPDLEAWVAAHIDTIDAIHVTNVTLDSFIHPIVDLARAHHIPLVMTPFIHLGEIGDRAFVRYYSMPQQLDILRQSQYVLTMTQREKVFLQQHGIDQSRIHVVGAGVTPADLQNGDADGFRTRHDIDAPIVLQVGAMARDKGTITTVHAMQQLWRTGHPAHLVLIGAPLQHFTQFLQQLDAHDRSRIHLLAYASDDEKRDAYAAAQLFVMPSRTDSFGIVFLEAWVNMLPVIGAHAGGIPDVISDGVDGVLVEFDQPTQLASAIAALLQDHDRAQSYAQHGYNKVVSSMTWEHVYHRVERLVAPHDP
ncbi:MAG: glycosyltransferase family 4 protein [Chloroflexi bacterium]|nr:glycosyltransferase family 4 protein [Chloroflexota bacterium]